MASTLCQARFPLQGETCDIAWPQGYGIINLFLLANLVTTTSTLPVLLGLLEGPRARRIITPFSALFGCWFAFAALVVWAAAMAGTWGLSTSDVRLVLPLLAGTCIPA